MENKVLNSILQSVLINKENGIMISFIETISLSVFDLKKL